MKKLIPVLLSLLMALAMTATALAATVYTEGALHYTIADESITITGYFGKDAAVTVPASIAGIPVNTIAKGAFTGNDNVKTVDLPDTITAVEEGAFASGITVNYNSNINGGNTPDDSKPDDSKPDDSKPDDNKPNDNKPADNKPNNGGSGATTAPTRAPWTWTTPALPVTPPVPRAAPAAQRTPALTRAPSPWTTCRTLPTARPAHRTAPPFLSRARGSHGCGCCWASSPWRRSSASS